MIVVVERPALAQQRVRGHQETRRAETALQRMIFLERLLQRAERAIGRETFHRRELGLIRLYRQHQAGADRRAVMLHRATAAYAMLAADVGSGQK